MMNPTNDPFPTMRMSVPNLPELLARLRSDSIKHGVTIVHAKAQGEGDWILGTASARLKRGNLKIVGPEPHTPKDLVEHALRIGAKIVLAGELRREEDSRALRAAAALGVHAVGVITAGKLSEAQALLAFLGPWTNYDVSLLSDTV
ncbi:MAG TPA: hypothetical protein VMH02_05975 [Verrucomicrobiae bacterium]|nr:hypothetical protein [Verrucomicrobiae bacterium]